HVTYVKHVEGSLYRAARAGFMRIDFLRDGRRRLGVLEVREDGGYRETFARILEVDGRPGSARAAAAAGRASSSREPG
ncbi:MAG TPA: hypothetical protein VGB87_03790, partial [Vicinamibacteria bacterium]